MTEGTRLLRRGRRHGWGLAPSLCSGGRRTWGMRVTGLTPLTPFVRSLKSGATGIWLPVVPTCAVAIRTCLLRMVSAQNRSQGADSPLSWDWSGRGYCAEHSVWLIRSLAAGRSETHARQWKCLAGDCLLLRTGNDAEGGRGDVTHGHPLRRR